MSQKTILVVDDEKDILEIFSDYFSDYKVHTASNPHEALKLIKDHTIDVIVSDINMPKMTGLEMMSEIRRLGYNMPVIFMTGFSDVQKIKEAWKLGAYDFIDKPVNFETLTSVIKNALIFGVSIPEQKAVESNSLVSLQINMKNEDIKSLEKLAKEKNVTVASLVEEILKNKKSA